MSKRISRIMLFLSVILVSVPFFRPLSRSPFDIKSFGQMPVIHGGRLKPMDSLARSSLLLIHGSQTIRVEGAKIPASEWLLQVLFDAPMADQQALFRIDDSDVLSLMKVEQSKSRYYSFSQLRPFLDEIEMQSQMARSFRPELRSAFQAAVLQLNSQLLLYHSLQNSLQLVGLDNVALLYRQSHDRIRAEISSSQKLSEVIDQPVMKELNEYMNLYGFMKRVSNIFPIPAPTNPIDKERWLTMGDALIASLAKPELAPGVLIYSILGDSYRAGDIVIFSQTLESYKKWLRQTTPQIFRQVKIEFYFNCFDPFSQAMILYLIIFLLIAFSWVFWGPTLKNTALTLLQLTFVIHSLGLIGRMYLQGRPPVTNLYSSAIFIGWVGVLMGIILERIMKKGWSSLVASILGFSTLIIAHHLMDQGDTLEMMRAVLDSNFWLSTHVVTITIGYSSTYFSGLLALVYVFRQYFDRDWNRKKANDLEKTVYGIVCFSTLFSFLGTVLGGIWADQSWGRFWGWDPKENGALMIVLWNAFLLHARWGKIVGQKTQIALTLGGNIVTTFSWFGVNMLGVGLHSYGFMEKTFLWIVLFTLSQIGAIIFALQGPLPTKISKNV